MKKVLLALLAVFAISCAHARHVAVVASLTFDQAVFAADDAETKACQTGAMTPESCKGADAKIAAALLDARALVKALQNTPKNIAVPKSLPDLLADLTAAQKIIAPFAGAPNVPKELKTLDTALSAAVTEAISVVRLLSGGK